MAAPNPSPMPSHGGRHIYASNGLRQNTGNSGTTPRQKNPYNAFTSAKYQSVIPIRA